MLRWILGGRETQSSVERSPVLCIGEDQPLNVFTELQVLKGHSDIVRFLLKIDDVRFASAGDDGLVLIWNIETGERLQELRGHTQQITAITTFTCRHDASSSSSSSTSSSPSPPPSPSFLSLSSSSSLSPPRIITASSDRSLSLWDPDSGNRIHTVSDLQSSVKCVCVLQSVCVWLSGGEELCVWNKDFHLKANKQNHSDSGITSLIELPQSCVAASMDRDVVIYRLLVSCDSASCDSGSCDSVSVAEIRRLSDHQDQIRAMISVNDGVFATGSHAGELVLWDSLNWNILAYEHILWEEPAGGVSTEIRLATPTTSEMSIQHLSTNGKLLLAAVGVGLYVYSIESRAVVAYRKEAHHSNVLHTHLLSDSELMSCSEDGSVRMWAIQDLPLPAEPTSPGFFSLWSFGRSSKPPPPVSSSPVNKSLEAPPLRTLELTGDLIGHSGAVQMFVSFGGGALVTCSTDHLLIVWRDGERESIARSLELFQRLEERGGL